MKTVIEKQDSLSPLFAADGKTINLQPGSQIIRGKTRLSASKSGRGLIRAFRPLPGTDYSISLSDDGLSVARGSSPMAIGGFHVGLDGQIAPHSIWDTHFRPKCTDPRGMVLVAGQFWCDIYLLNDNPQKHGTSKAGLPIADGYTPPVLSSGEKASRFTWWNAVEIYGHHGKQLLTMDEFTLAAGGVTDGSRCGSDPETTGHAAKLKSKWGVEQATGCMWTWGRNFDPHYGRAVIMGGSWDASNAGSRRFLNYPPDDWGSYIGARGRCDHLILS